MMQVDEKTEVRVGHMCWIARFDTLSEGQPQVMQVRLLGLTDGKAICRVGIAQSIEISATRVHATEAQVWHNLQTINERDVKELTEKLDTAKKYSVYLADKLRLSLNKESNDA